MKNLTGLILLLSCGAALIAGCAGQPLSPRVPSPAEQVQLGAPVDFRERGEYLYIQYCAACHGPQGIGRTEYFPNLRTNPFVVAAPESAAQIILHGRGLMPPFRNQLTDEDAAAVLTFIRTVWNNEDEPVLPATIEQLR